MNFKARLSNCFVLLFYRLDKTRISCLEIQDVVVFFFLQILLSKNYYRSSYPIKLWKDCFSITNNVQDNTCYYLFIDKLFKILACVQFETKNFAV